MAVDRGKNHWQLKIKGTNGGDLLLMPHELLNEFVAYEDYCKNNPLYEGILVQKTENIVEVPKKRVMTLKGFCLFAGIAQGTFMQYARDTRFKNICQAIRDAIYVDKFEGAAAGLYNAPLVMRDLGLHDTVQHTLEDKRKDVDSLFPSSKEIDEVEVVETSEDEIRRINEEN